MLRDAAVPDAIEALPPVLADYFAAEVLDKVPWATAQLLLATSVLPRVTAEWAAALAAIAVSLANQLALTREFGPDWEGNSLGKVNRGDRI